MEKLDLWQAAIYVGPDVLVWAGERTAHLNSGPSLRWADDDIRPNANTA